MVRTWPGLNSTNHISIAYSPSLIYIFLYISFYKDFIKRWDMVKDTSIIGMNRLLMLWFLKVEPNMLNSD